MPIVPIIVTTRKGQVATLMTLSEERYRQYMELHYLLEYSVSAKFFIDYLSKHNAQFTLCDIPQVSVPVETITDEGLVVPPSGNVEVYKDAIVFDVQDVKMVCGYFNLNYKDFIDAYAEHLKSL